jgi:hypothetical protein
MTNRTTRRGGAWVAAGVATSLLLACGSGGDSEPAARSSTQALQVLHCSMSFCANVPPPPPCYELQCNWVVGRLGEPAIPTCEQEPIASGAFCDDPIACIAGGECDGDGTCVPSPGEELTCTPTPLGEMDDIRCFCFNEECIGMSGTSVWPNAPWACTPAWR